MSISMSWDTGAKTPGHGLRRLLERVPRFRSFALLAQDEAESDVRFPVFWGSLDPFLNDRRGFVQPAGRSIRLCE
jgi:hypothetical protein